MTPIAPDSPDTRQKHAIWWLLLIALLLLGAGIGLRDPWPSDEPRFTLVAKQMVETGEWLIPHRGSELYSDKPPMLMWMEAATFEVVRNWRIAFLLPSLLAGLLTIALTYDLGRRLWNRRVGLYAAAALLVTFQFVFQVKRAQIDPLVMAWITLANWGLIVHFLRGPNWRAYWLGCFAAGLGVITKGVGALALLMFLPYVFARMRGWDDVLRTPTPAWRWLAGPLAFLVAVALWLAPMLWTAYVRGTPEYVAYVHDILFHQTAGRYAGSWSHPQPAWYYLTVILLAWFPLSLAWPAALPRWWRELKARDARFLLPLAWTLLILVFFSIARGKRDVYIMPALPMVALALGPYLQQLCATRWLRTSALAIAIAAGALLFGVGAWALLANPPLLQKLVQSRDMDGDGVMLWIMLLGMGAAFLVAAAWFRRPRGLHALLAGIAGIWMFWSLMAYPILNDSSSAAAVMRRTNEVIGPNAELGMVAWKEQNLLMVDRPVTDFGFLVPWPEQFVAATHWLAQAPQSRWVFALDDAMGNCVDRDRAIALGHANRRQWWLFRNDAVVPGCVPKAGSESESHGGD